MIDYGNGLIFPDSWAYGPEDPPETVSCPCCGEDMFDVCEHCGVAARPDQRKDSVGEGASVQADDPVGLPPECREDIPF